MLGNPDMVRVLDQTLTEDFFAAMERVEQRLNITRELI
jgi:hypothetical protein